MDDTRSGGVLEGRGGEGVVRERFLRFGGREGDVSRTTYLRGWNSPSRYMEKNHQGQKGAGQLKSPNPEAGN